MFIRRVGECTQNTHFEKTHLSASDSFATMALYKFIYLLTYLKKFRGNIGIY